MCLKESSQFALKKSGSLPQAQVDPAEPGAPPTPAIASCAIRINNFVRPFVEKNCRELLEQYGKVTDMWMPSIKTHCYVVYETEEDAMRAYKSTYNLEWPVGGRKLIPLMVPAEDARLEIERGRARTAGKSSTAADLQGVSNAGYARASGGIGMVRALSSCFKSKQTSLLHLTWCGYTMQLDALIFFLCVCPQASDNRLERGPSGTHPQFGGPYRRPVNRPVTLEDLFFKTHTKPPLYFLPLTDEQIMEKRKEEGKAGNTEPARYTICAWTPCNQSVFGCVTGIVDQRSHLGMKTDTFYCLSQESWCWKCEWYPSLEYLTSRQCSWSSRWGPQSRSVDKSHLLSTRQAVGICTWGIVLFQQAVSGMSPRHRVVNDKFRHHCSGTDRKVQSSRK